MIFSSDLGQSTSGAYHRTAAPLAWRRSSRCGSESCVEVAGLPDGGVAVRDSKSAEAAPVLVFTADEWAAFISGVKVGEFG
jgi:Domain of unknown function (DUF397)